MQQKQSKFTNRSPEQRIETMRGLQVRRSITPGRRQSRQSNISNNNSFIPTQSYKQLKSTAKVPLKSKSNRFVQNTLPLTQKQSSYQNYNFRKSNNNITQSSIKSYQRQQTPKLNQNEKQVRNVSTRSTNLDSKTEKIPLFNTNQYSNKSVQELPGFKQDIEYLNKEIYELQKQLNAEKEQNRKLMDLGKNELICIEEVEVKKVFGKKKDIQEKLQLSQKISQQNNFLNQELKKKDLQIQQLRYQLQQQHQQGQKVIYIKESQTMNEKITIEKEKNNRYLQNIGELQQLQKNLKDQLEQKLQAEQKLNNKLFEQDKLLNYYKQKSQKRFTFQNDQQEDITKNYQQQIELQNKTILNLKKQNQELALKLNTEKEYRIQQKEKNEIQKLNKNLQSLNSVLLQKNDEIEMLKNQVNLQYSQPNFENKSISVSATPQQDQVQKLMDTINEKSYKIDKLKQAIIDLKKEKVLHENLEKGNQNEYQNYEQQYKNEIDDLQIKNSNMQKENQDLIKIMNEFKDKVEKEIQSVNKQMDQHQNSFQQSIVNFETQEQQQDISVSNQNFNSQDIIHQLDKVIEDLRNTFTKMFQFEQTVNNHIEQDDDKEIKKQLENLKTQNQFLLKFFSKTRNNILDIIKEMPEETGIKIFFDSIERDQQFGEYFRQKLQNILKLIEVQCLQISENQNQQNESFSVDMNIKSKNRHFQSSNNLQATNLLKEKEDLEKYNNILSEKVLNAYQKIAYLESQLRQHKAKNQAQNNQKFIELTEEIEKIRKERDDIQQKEMSLRKKIENKRKSMLNELNSFVKTKKQFEQSFLSELTKQPNSNQLFQIYNESLKK